jgi:hypothetical protein
MGAQAPENILELRAAEQRRRLQHALLELRHNAAQRVDVKNLARSHFWPAAAMAALLGVVAGFVTGGWFAD